MRKSEIRSSNNERNPNYEIRNLGGRKLTPSRGIQQSCQESKKCTVSIAKEYRQGLSDRMTLYPFGLYIFYLMNRFIPPSLAKFPISPGVFLGNANRPFLSFLRRFYHAAAASLAVSAARAVSNAVMAFRPFSLT